MGAQATVGFKLLLSSAFAVVCRAKSPSAMIAFRGATLFVAVHVSRASNLTHSSSMDTYCPTAGDFGSDGNVQWHGNGWTIYGSGGVHSKTSWNLNGGYIEFDMDTSRANAEVNTNLYTTSPERGQLSGSNDCDIQGQGKPTCMEMDIVEANGNCAAQTTVHTWPNHNGDCDQGGCWSGIRIGGKFHVKAEFSPGGWMTVLFNGQKNEHYQPSPSKNSQNYAAQTMQRLGAQIQSSQWKGWVPEQNSCPRGGDLGSSHFSIENLVVRGSVVQGQQPTRCASLGISPDTNATSAGSDAPSPGPSPRPAPCKWCVYNSQCSGAQKCHRVSHSPPLGCCMEEPAVVV